MAFYIGKEKFKIHLKGIVYKNRMPNDKRPILLHTLLSADNYTLKDENNLYLIPKEVK